MLRYPFERKGDGGDYPRGSGEVTPVERMVGTLLWRTEQPNTRGARGMKIRHAIFSGLVAALLCGGCGDKKPVCPSVDSELWKGAQKCDKECEVQYQGKDKNKNVMYLCQLQCYQTTKSDTWDGNRLGACSICRDFEELNLLSEMSEEGTLEGCVKKQEAE